MSSAINDVWNYCNEVSLLAFRRDKTFLSAYDLHKLTAGTSKNLRLSADTIQQVCTEYVTQTSPVPQSEAQVAQPQAVSGVDTVQGRVYQHSLGDTVTYCGHRFHLSLSRPVEETIKRAASPRMRWALVRQLPVRGS